MKENLISVFARGNQELFHSAFLAWLLRPTAPHGLGDAFLSAVLSRLPPSYAINAAGEYEVRTEFREGRSRFDIVVRPTDAASASKGIVFENKAKSFGNHLQLDGYKDRGYDVAVFALLPETLDTDTKARYPVIEYKTVREILCSFSLDTDSHYHFLVAQYSDFLEGALRTFDLFRGLADGTLEPRVFLEQLATAVSGFDFSDNDVRTFDYFYYHNFAEYLRTQAPDLCFGDADYARAEREQVNMRWNYEKNMQGPPFMESILFNPFDPKMSWKMHESFTSLYKTAPFQIAPRLELRLDPAWLAQRLDIDLEVGKVMLGTWSDDLKRTLREREPYRSRLRPAGSRNFHREWVRVQQLPFQHLAGCLRRTLGVIFDRQTGAAHATT